MFMRGVEHAILANDACGSPVPRSFTQPWNFFDGKLFQLKFLQAKDPKMNVQDLCDGKVGFYCYLS